MYIPSCVPGSPLFFRNPWYDDKMSPESSEISGLITVLKSMCLNMTDAIRSLMALFLVCGFTRRDESIAVDGDESLMLPKFDSSLVKASLWLLVN